MDRLWITAVILDLWITIPVTHVYGVRDSVHSYRIIWHGDLWITPELRHVVVGRVSGLLIHGLQ